MNQSNKIKIVWSLIISLQFPALGMAQTIRVLSPQVLKQASQRIAPFSAFKALACHSPNDCKMEKCEIAYRTIFAFTHNNELPKKVLPHALGGVIECYAVSINPDEGGSLLDLVRQCAVEGSIDFIGVQGCINPIGNTGYQMQNFLVWSTPQDVESFNQQTNSNFDPNRQYVLCYNPTMIDDWIQACSQNCCE